MTSVGRLYVVRLSMEHEGGGWEDRQLQLEGRSLVAAVRRALLQAARPGTRVQVLRLEARTGTRQDTAWWSKA